MSLWHLPFLFKKAELRNKNAMEKHMTKIKLQEKVMPERNVDHRSQNLRRD